MEVSAEELLPSSAVERPIILPAYKWLYGAFVSIETYSTCDVEVCLALAEFARDREPGMKQIDQPTEGIYSTPQPKAALRQPFRQQGKFF